MELQSIRQKLKLSRQDLATYLGISPHTVKSIELNRREVPLDHLDEKADLIKVLLDTDLQRQAVAHVAVATPEQLRKIRTLRLTYRRRLNNYTLKLQKMQENYTTAAMGLVVVQQLAASLAEAVSKDDRDRLKWTKRKTKELNYILEASNQTAQEMLTLEIDSLQARIARLEELLAGPPATSR